MEYSKGNQALSNERHYFRPNSIKFILLEDELKRRNIKYIKRYTSKLRPSIAYSFFEKDILTVNSILEDIEKKSGKIDEMRRLARKTALPKAKQKRIAIGLILCVFSIVALIMIL